MAENDIKLSQSENLLNGVVKVGGLIGAAYSIPGVIKYSGLQKIQGVRGSRMANIVEGYYDKGVTPADKFRLTINQAQFSETNDAIKLLKKGLKQGAYGPHGALLDELNHSLPAGERFGSLQLNEFGERGGYNYSNVDANDPKIIEKIKKASRSGRVQGIKSVGEAVALGDYDLEVHRGAVNPDGISKKGRFNRIYRHEIAKNELVRHVHGLEDVNYKNLERSGISAPKNTTAGTFFTKNNKDVMGKWQLFKDDIITYSNVTNTSDKRLLNKAVKKDLAFELQEYVTKYADLKSPNSIKSTAERGMASLTHSRRYMHHAEIPDDILNNFLKNAKVKNGNLIFNFTPARKPHYLLGGVNVNSSMFLDNRGILKYDILTTDMYDITGSGTQRKRHVTWHQDTNITTVKDGKKIAQFRPRTASDPYTLFQDAYKKGDQKDMIKYGKKSGTKALNFISNEFFSKRYAPNKAMLKGLAWILSKGKIKLR